jgi:hypothetical protein
MDDPKKLEKALKRQTKEKRKKREAWNERTKAVEKLQEQKQKKRRDNIEKRKEQIRDKKKGGIKAKGNPKSGSAGKAKKSVKLITPFRCLFSFYLFFIVFYCFITR